MKHPCYRPATDETHSTRRRLAVIVSLGRILDGHSIDQPLPDLCSRHAPIRWHDECGYIFKDCFQSSDSGLLVDLHLQIVLCRLVAGHLWGE